MKAVVAVVLASLAPVAGPALAQAPGLPAAPTPGNWLPRPGVDLVALDKVSARATTLSGRVGQELHFGTLTLIVRACLVRPPDAAPDAAAFLDITDSRPPPRPFQAWMVLSAPALSIYEHPLYDIRLAGCQAAP